MYFSVITPQEGYLRQAAYEMAQSGNLYQQHQWLWRFFPQQTDQARDFLFRRHQLGSETTPLFYVVSACQPQACGVAWCVQTKPYHPKLVEGDRLRFELRANPVITKKNADGKSQRHDVVMEAKKHWQSAQNIESTPDVYELVQQAGSAWLQARAERHGFSVSQVQADAYLQHRAGQRGIRFSTLDFSGELQVTDAALFETVLMSGLGHAKAFGCGLLLIKRV